MSLVVLVESPLTEYAEAEMRRWWRHRCKKHERAGEVFFEVSYPFRLNGYEGVRRLRSFGVTARIARRRLES